MELIQAVEQDRKDAIDLLCAMVHSTELYKDVPLPLLLWYHGHRAVDLRRAQDTRFLIDGFIDSTVIKDIEADLYFVEAALELIQRGQHA